MSSQEAPSLLRAVGIDEDEEAIYRVLIGASESTAARLAQRSGRTRTHVTKVLESMAEKGLVAKAPGPATRYRALDPQDALELLILRRQEDLERIRIVGKQLHKEFVTNADRPSVVELVEMVTSSDALRERLAQLHASTQSEQLAFDKPPYVTDIPSGEQLKEGVTYRSLYDRASLQHPGIVASLPSLRSAGEYARVTSVPFKALIMDRRVAVIPLDADPSRAGAAAVVVHSVPLVHALVILFENLWERAAPLIGVGSSIASDMPPECSEAFALLVAGLQDRAATRRMGISQSTMDRRVRRILESLGATTRFQAGYLAAQRGWGLDDDL